MRLFLLVCLFVCAPVIADISPLTLKEFLQQGFQSRSPQVQVLPISPELRQKIEPVLGHAYEGGRIRYWINADMTAWVLDEVGKEQPITIGVVVHSGKVETLRVLTYREDHGAEVLRPSFLNQFEGLALTENGRLDRRVDGITGATLSVKAVAKVAKVALLLDREVQGREGKSGGVAP